MTARVIRLPQIADPTIDQVLKEFLEDQRMRLKKKTLQDYEGVIGLLRSCLDGYAYEGLSEQEAALFDQYYAAEGEAHREYCQLFGPEKIIENLSYFLDFFMIRKVIAGAGFKRMAGTVVKKLFKWMAAKEYISGEDCEEGVIVGAEATQSLPKAERAAEQLFQETLSLRIDPQALDDEDYQEFDYYTVSNVEPGKLWLEVPGSGSNEPLGPIPVSKKVSAVLRPGWEISCALGRVRGKWRIIEVGSVYPC